MLWHDVGLYVLRSELQPSSCILLGDTCTKAAKHEVGFAKAPLLLDTELLVLRLLQEAVAKGVLR